MPEFLFPSGAVYILENTEARRVKVGMTGLGTSSVESRLREVNDKWLERKVTCQICGTRLNNVAGRVPTHQISGNRCIGGGEWPLEKNVDVAALSRKSLQSQLSDLTGADLGAAVRRIKTLTSRIEKYREHKSPVGCWEFRIAFYTASAAEVERLSHKKLAAQADEAAPIGEVFCCSVTDAMAAVEAALVEAGERESARTVTQLGSV